MAKTFTFAGYSDDTFGSVEGDDYDNCASGKPIVWRLSAGDESLLVWGQYAPKETAAGSWVVGITNDEGPDSTERPIPAWPIRLQQGASEYTPALVIEAPDGAEQTLVYPKADD